MLIEFLARHAFAIFILAGTLLVSIGLSLIVSGMRDLQNHKDVSKADDID